MSRRLVSKADIDAYVTIALGWTERGEIQGLPEPARSVLTVTRDNASDVGQRLWYGNARRFIEFDEADFAHDPGSWEDVQEDKAWWESVTPYVFEEFPGQPHPETAFRIAAFYSYQSADDDWERSSPDGPRFEVAFTTSVKWYALRQLGLVQSSAVPEPFADELRVDLSGRPTYDASGWGLSENDRDLFLRIA